jgi:hypothetical protein
MNTIASIKYSPFAFSGSRIDTEISVDETKYNIYFQSNTEQLAPDPNALVAASLLPAMKHGGRLEVSEPGISSKLETALNTIQDIYSFWQPKLNRIQLSSLHTPQPLPTNSTKRIGTFFSGGMDSFYTLLKHNDSITDVIFVHGFDIDLAARELLDITTSRLQDAADEMGKNLILIETNLRELTDPYAEWGPLAHGAALASIGHLLHKQFSRIYIPASYTYTELFPWGSHPVLDHLWSSEALEFIHDSCEATRIQKAELIAQSDAALNNLRVCWENRNGKYNCGECEKCIRTMINLLANNALDRCTTFDSPLTPQKAARICANSAHIRTFIKENLKALEKVEGTHSLRKALERVLKRSPRRSRIRKRIRRMLNLRT